MKVGPTFALSALSAPLLVKTTDSLALSLKSPATATVLDFSRQPPNPLPSGMSVDEASTVMSISQTKIKLVINKDQQVLGVITLLDLNSVKVLATAQAMGIPRRDLSVRDLMTPVSKLQAIHHASLENARVADVVDTLEHNHQRFLVVLDDHQQLSGLICADELVRRLGKPLDTQPLANDFGAVFTALRK